MVLGLNLTIVIMNKHFHSSKCCYYVLKWHVIDIHFLFLTKHSNKPISIVGHMGQVLLGVYIGILFKHNTIIAVPVQRLVEK